MNRLITLLFLMLFFFTSYGQTSKENRKKSNASKKETPISVNRVEQDSIMRSRGGISSENGLTWAIPNETTSPLVPEKEDLKVYERKEVEVKADFNNGNTGLETFLDQNFVVSKKIKEKKITGEIALSFIVEKDGSLTGFKIIKNLGYDTDKEIERVVKLGKWYPSELNGKKVRSTYNLAYKIKNNND